jgi:cell division initiation protein
LEISPLDVRNQVFKRKMKGYDQDEVKQFLDAVADRMEQMLKAKEELATENAALKQKAAYYVDMEQTLKDTLVTAQKISADARANAKQSAQNILREAEIEAEKKVSSIVGQVEHIARSRDTLKAETMALIVKLRSMIEAQLSYVASMEGEITKQAAPQKKGVGVAEGAQSPTV